MLENLKTYYMQRRIFLKNSLATAAALSIGSQQILKALSIEPWKITMLTKDIGIFTEKGGTIAFQFSKDGITVVDAQFPDSVTHLIDALKKQHDAPYHLLINTHHHGDHTSGNIVFKNMVTRVLAHENSLANQQRVANSQQTMDKQYFPNEIFQTMKTVHLGNENITLYYDGAAHTNGDGIIHFEHANIVHMGDLIFNRRHPFVDRSAGANIKSWIQVLEKSIGRFDDTTIFICGHSGNGYDIKGSKEMLRNFKTYLANLLEFVAKEIKAGKTKEEILANTEIPGSPEWKGDGVQRPLQAAFEELTIP